jgi:hypothetical protein
MQGITALPGLVSRTEKVENSGDMLGKVGEIIHFHRGTLFGGADALLA